METFEIILLAIALPLGVLVSLGLTLFFAVWWLDRGRERKPGSQLPPSNPRPNRSPAPAYGAGLVAG